MIDDVAMWQCKSKSKSQIEKKRTKKNKKNESKLKEVEKSKKWFMNIYSIKANTHVNKIKKNKNLL